MSRCFPYPPPGYLVKRDNSDALIESIKLQKATEKVKEERRAEKKEKKRDKKEKKHHDKKDKKDHDKKRKRTDEKVHKSEKETAYLKGKALLLNGGDEECEQRSGVTEEHEQPSRPCYSSDSTENSNKRRRPNLPEYGISSSGSTLKIRFKRKETDPVVDNERPLAASIKPVAAPFPVAAPLASINAGASLKQGSNALLVEEQPSTSVRNEVARPEKEQGCSTSGMSTDPSQLIAEKSSVAPVVPHVSKRVKKASNLYKELFENWSVPSLQQMDLDDDQDWLFGRKSQKQGGGIKVDGSGSSAGCSLSSTMWPRAQFLPEVDVYALPFTVPF